MRLFTLLYLLIFITGCASYKRVTALEMKLQTLEQAHDSLQSDYAMFQKMQSPEIRAELALNRDSSIIYLDSIRANKDKSNKNMKKLTSIKEFSEAAVVTIRENKEESEVQNVVNEFDILSSYFSQVKSDIDDFYDNVNIKVNKANRLASKSESYIDSFQIYVSDLKDDIYFLKRKSDSLRNAYNKIYKVERRVREVEEDLKSLEFKVNNLNTTE